MWRKAVKECDGLDLTASVPVIDLISRAFSLDETLEAGKSSLEDHEPDTRSRRLTQVLGGEGKRDVVLSQYGLTARQLDSLRVDRSERPHGRLPHWHGTATRIVAAALARRVPGGPVEVIGPDSAANALLAPFLAVAEDVLGQGESFAWRNLTLQACQSFKSGLAVRLVEIMRRTLSLEWEVYCSLRRREPGGMSERDGDLARAFASWLKDGGTLAILNEYPVLIRLGAVAIDHWMATTRGFLARLARDRPSIAERFRSPAGRVIAISHNLSDLHNGHQCVSRVTFESGLVVFYKPRPAGCESAFGRVVDWVNRHDPSAGLRSVEIVDRGDYCWVREVDHAPCTAQHEGKGYYRRAGMLLALMYILHGRDIHHENLIASGATPYLIDVETILEPGPTSDTDVPWSEERASQVPTVFDVGLLPCLFVDPAGIAVDTSGLRGVGNEIREAGAQAVASPHRPFVGGAVLDPTQYSDDLIAGFRDAYRLVMSNRSGPSGLEGELAAFRGTFIRVILRHTASYAALRDLSTSPKHLRNGIDRSIELHFIGKPVTDEEWLVKQWPAFRSELRALEELDLPQFIASAHETHLFDASGLVLEGCLAAAPLDRVIADLGRLGDDDCDKQIGLIRSSLNLPGVRLESVVSSHSRPIPDRDKAAWAVSLGEMLLRDALRQSDGSIAWQKRWEGDVQPTPQLIDDGLFGGSLGLAFFFAALHRHTGRNDFREAVGRAAAPALARICGGRTPAGADARGPFGLSAGVGSQCYAFARLAGFLDDRTFLSHALRAMQSVDTTKIAGDVALDLLDGLAGDIVGLVVLFEVTSDSGPLDVAAGLAARLLHAWRASLGRHRSSRADGRQPEVGFSHGASGIAYALCRLHAHRPDPRLLGLIREALDYERAVFEAGRADWTMFVSPGRRGLEASWCWGAAGVALARLALADTLPDPDIREELETALQTTRWAPPSDAFHLCCGHIGRLAVEFEAALRLPRPDLLGHVEGALESTLYRTLAHAGAQFFPNLGRGSYNAGLFQGLAGVGYQLLRFADPSKYPSLLSFD